jgi:hypothetical protein
MSDARTTLFRHTGGMLAKSHILTNAICGPVARKNSYPGRSALEALLSRTIVLYLDERAYTRQGALQLVKVNMNMPGRVFAPKNRLRICNLTWSELEMSMCHTWSGLDMSVTCVAAGGGGSDGRGFAFRAGNVCLSLHRSASA